MEHWIHRGSPCLHCFFCLFTCLGKMQTLFTDAKYCKVVVPIYCWIWFFLHLGVIFLFIYVFMSYKCLKEDKISWKNKGYVPRKQCWCVKRNKLRIREKLYNWKLAQSKSKLCQVLCGFQVVNPCHPHFLLFCTCYL